MKITLLGTGDPIGMPVPPGDQSVSDWEERNRPSLKVETEETTVVLDVTPDIYRQLYESGTEDVDGFFITHTHNDHAGGLPDLNNLMMRTDVQVYGSEAVKSYIDDFMPWLEIDFKEICDGETVEEGDLSVTAVPVEHSEMFSEQAFCVEKDGRKVVYCPDLKAWKDTERLEEPDLLVVDGLYLFEEFMDDPDHESLEELESEIKKLDAEETVLVNISEHWTEMSTEELERKAEEKGFRICSDYEEIEI